MKIDAPCRIQLTETPILHPVCDRVVQAEWLFAQVRAENKLENQSSSQLNSVIAETKL